MCMSEGFEMLIEFTFENFKCYRGETTLQMTAAPIGEHAETLIPGPGKKGILPVAAIYGPNGGGKSSVLQALTCLERLVTMPYLVLRARLSKTPRVECRPYAFEAESRSEATTFCAIFQVGDYTYRYILSVLGGEVSEEYLHRRKVGRGAEATLFERSDGAVELGSSLRRKGVNTDVDSMMPYLSFLAINYDIEAVEEAFGWFLDCQVLDYSESSFEDYFMEPRGDDERRLIVRMLNAMDIDIAGIRYQRDEDGLEIYLTHESGDGTELELGEESNGTRKLLNLVPPFLRALESGCLVVSDELDAKLHPKLLRYLITLFTNREINRNGAQLVFTSHDMTTLNSSVFRRDEIWFAAKTPEGPSTLYSLSDIVDVDGKRVRTQNAYDRQYLAGRYGADPYLRSMLEWGGADEQ